MVELERATALCELNRFADAITALSRILASDPNNAHAWCLMAQAQLGEGDSNNALEAAKEAVSNAPRQEWPYRLASVALGGLGRHGEATQAAREAVALDPNAWQTHAQLAHAASHAGAGAGELREAELAASRTVALAPHQAGAHIAAGAVAAALGRRSDAAGAFRRALEIDPQNSAAHHELARLHLRKNRLRAAEAGRLADAASGFATAVRTDPRSAPSRRNLDGVLRVFLARTAYFIFLDAFLVARSSAHSTQSLGRLLPIALLLLPVAFALRFILRLSPTLRPYLLRLVLAPGIRLAAGAEALAVAAMLAGGFVAQPSRPGVAGAAGVAALAGRVILYRERKRAVARA
jgi:tetratricopeptide (TPR) repeat protein